MSCQKRKVDIPGSSYSGIEWRDDCHVFLSCGKDGYIIQHIFADAKRPADHVSLAGVDLSISGEIGFAYFDKKGQLIIFSLFFF